jgi:hypothetical protein
VTADAVGVATRIFTDVAVPTIHMPGDARRNVRCYPPSPATSGAFLAVSIWEKRLR